MEINAENVEKLNVGNHPGALLAKGLLIDCINAGDALEEKVNNLEKRIKELEAENTELKKKVPVWHKLDKPLYVDENGNDVWDLPNEDESLNDEVYTLHKCGVYGTEQWDEIDPEVIAMWCELPTAPQTTEKSSATEKEDLS